MRKAHRNVAILHVTRTGCARFTPAGAAVSDADGLLIEVPEEYALPEAVAENTARAWALNLLRESRTRDPGWQHIVEGLILQGLGHLERLRQLSATRPSWLDDVVQLAREYRTLADIAQIIGRHPSHIAREFHRHEGVTVGEYARRCRLELAANALRAHQHSISEVAMEAGFCDQSHFTNAFRRVFGVTPGAYRRSARSRSTRAD